ncbi:MAG: ATP-dependent Clp protease ATP-binding subunit [Prevotella sp.]|nr:ATP-dependent Clp protease ATP-binding subunit [Prevotella sp.]
MNNNFSSGVMALLNKSRREAIRHKSPVVKPEHLLLAMLKEKDTFTDKIINKLKLDKIAMTLDCESAMNGNNEPQTSDTQETDNLEMDNKLNSIMVLASLEARIDKTETIDEKHLLLAMLHDSKGNEARTIMENNDMTYDNVTECLTEDVSTPVNGMELSDDDYNDTLEPEDNNKKPATETQTPQKKNGKTPVIDTFSVDLTQAAAEGKLDRVVGREKEIQRLQEILCRRKKNNPVLIGEPGVGKSSIVEGLAQMIAERMTSPVLHNKRLVSLDLSSMVAGTKYRGQFEERIKNLIKELAENPDIIIFIDEIHTIIGAGNAQGSMDAANMLKPALARGTVQCIGATTTDEYRKSIEKDGALERRFQKILVEPSSPEETIHILNNIKDRYEEHHHVNYNPEAIEACVKLTQRYITDRAFPDKAIDALDEVGSKIHLHNADVPNEIIEIENTIRDVKEKKLQSVRDQNFELAANYRDQQSRLESDLERLHSAWLRGDSGNRNEVTADDVADVVSMMSGVPVQRVVDSEGERLRNMAGKLKTAVIAQDKAIETMVHAIQRNRIGLHDPNHPIGVFMFLGPTGVGKTYLAKKLAEEMFGSADALIRIDMSEYAEAFNTSRLVGAPPGYVGYEEGGQLTERVRRKPYSIVLLDEIEKANANVFNLLLQVLDEGRLTDGNGRLVDFRNTVIIMTSNAGTRQLKEFAHGVGFNAAGSRGYSMSEKDKEYARDIIQKSLSKQFAPEFLNRLDEIITFDQLDLDAIKKIVDLELKPVCDRVRNLGYELVISDAKKEELAKKGYDVQYGARPLKRAIQTYVEDVACEKILYGNLEPGQTIEI